MKIDSFVYKSIKDKLSNQKLIGCVFLHFEGDKWGGSITNLTNLIDNGSLNNFDMLAAKIFLCREYSFTYRYDKALEIINEHEKIEQGLKNNNVHNRSLKGFMYHNYAITLGYMGRKESDKRYSLFVSEAEKQYLALNAKNDINLLILHTIDIDTHYDTGLGLPGLIKRYDQLSGSVLDPYEIYFRKGILYLINHIRNGKTTHLSKAVDLLKKAYTDSNNKGYKYYWTASALTVAKYMQTGKNKSYLPERPPWGYKSKAKRFPIILFIVVRALRLTGDEKKAKKLLMGIERRLKILTGYFEDEKYKLFILENYGLVIEEWIQSLFEDVHLQSDKKFLYIIHVNEILQNRFLTEKLTGFLVNKDQLIHTANILKKFSNKRKNTGVLYISCRLKNSKNEDVLYLLKADNVKDKSTYSVHKIDCFQLDNLFNSFRKYFLNNPSSPKKNQDLVLEKYGEILFKDTCLNANKYVTIPNDFALTLPVHMARLNGQYLYENHDIKYLPNLHFSLNKKRKQSLQNKTVVYYHSKEKNAVKEAKTIERLLRKEEVKLIADPKLAMFKKTSQNSSRVHIVTHNKDGNIIFKGSIINLDDLCNSLPNNLNSAVFNICKGGKIENQSKYSIMYKSIAHALMLKNTGCIITHTWDLSQEASNVFSNKFYKSNENFSIPKELINKKPSEYGGYMIWGIK